MHAADRFSLLAWAGEREHVLAVIEALRAADYDEAACRHIVAIVNPPLHRHGKLSRITLADHAEPIPTSVFDARDELESFAAKHPGVIKVEVDYSQTADYSQTIAPPPAELLEMGKGCATFDVLGQIVCCQCGVAHTSMTCCSHDEPVVPR